MPSILTSTLGICAVIIAISYPLFLEPLLYGTLGFRRVIQDISDFPYTCRKIREPIAEGCEHLWIDHERRMLYATCAPAYGRVHWTPGMNALNVSGRSGADHVLALELDYPGADGRFNMQVVDISGYEGPAGSRIIDNHGFDVDVLDGETLRFIMINHRPPADEAGLLLDTRRYGANSTVEVLELPRGPLRTGQALQWKRTIADSAIYTPNGVASTGDGSFYLTNDKCAKKGLRRELFLLVPGGDVSYCPASGACSKASGNVNFKMPNGLARGADGRIYVPSSCIAKIWVFERRQDSSLTKVAEIDTEMPIDNLSVDATGDIYAAGFPDILAFTGAVPDPYNLEAPTTVWRFRRQTDASSGQVTYQQEKILEDKAMVGIGGATTVVHDTASDRLFLGGNYAPYISVCDRKK